MRIYNWIVKSTSTPAKAFRTAAFTALSIVVAAWVGFGDEGHTTLTGLWSTIADTWDFAGGAALLAFLGALGFHAPKNTA